MPESIIKQMLKEWPDEDLGGFYKIFRTTVTTQMQKYFFKIYPSEGLQYVKYIQKKTPVFRVFIDLQENRFYWISITRDKAVSLTT